MPSKGFVYVIHAVGTNRIKIGYSAEPEKRLLHLQTGSPFELRLLGKWPGTVEGEQRAHRILAKYRCSGEWFAVPPLAGLLIYQAVTYQELVFDTPTIWADLWRMERDGNSYRWRLGFTPERRSRPGGKITPGILKLLQQRPGKGRHQTSREKAEWLRKRATYLAILPTSQRGQMPEVRELDRWLDVPDLLM